MIIIAIVLGFVFSVLFLTLVGVFIYWIVWLVNRGLNHREEERRRRDIYLGELIKSLHNVQTQEDEAVRNELKKLQDLVIVVPFSKLQSDPRIKLRDDYHKTAYYASNAENNKIIQDIIYNVGLKAIAKDLSFIGEIKKDERSLAKVYYKDINQHFKLKIEVE